MSVARKTGSKPLAFVTALMVLFALAVPFLGSALANHGNTDPATVVFTGEGDSAAANTCNEITLTARGANSTAAEGETIDIAVTMSDNDLTQDLAIGFCDPDGAAGTSSNLGGPQTNFGGNQGGQTESSATPFCDVDDTNDDQNDGTYNDQNFGSANPNAVPGVGAAGAAGCDFRSDTFSGGTELPAVIHDECFTDNAGQCSFGITSNQEGTANVIAWFDTGQDEDVFAGGGSSADYTPDANDPRDTFVKTWTTGGTTQATTVTCTPPTDSNPEGTRHEFRCTATNSAGQPVTGATITFDVTSGPNAEEVGPTNCTGTTNQQGQTNAPATEDPAGEGQPTNSNSGACGYNDVITAQSPLGTDTITAYINNATPQPGQPVPTTGPDAGEPQTTIQKTWVGPGRLIDCGPETATNQIGTSHTITCTVTDRAGAAVQNVQVTFTNRGGPGDITATNNQFTNAQGQVTTTIATDTFDPEGTTTIRGEIVGQRGDNTPAGQTTATQECARAAGDPLGAPAGGCIDDVQKTWTRQPPTTTPPPGTTPPVEEVRHGRGVQITGFDHVKIPGKRSTGLIVKGRVTTDSGFAGCSNAVPVKVQIRLGGEWITRKTDTTNNNGVFKVLIRDVKAKYRAVATKHQIDDEDNSRLHICQRASDVRRHRHG